MASPDRRRCRRCFSPLVGGILLPLLGAAALLLVSAAAWYLLQSPPRFKSTCRRSTPIQVEKVYAEATWYFDAFGTCPTADDLVTENLITRTQATDQWGSSLRIRCTPTGIEVRSAGPDMLYDTADDFAKSEASVERPSDEITRTSTSCR
jgi:hypothetical protein